MKKPKRKISESEFQRLCSDYIYRNVYVCQSSLVDALLQSEYRDKLDFDVDHIENYYCWPEVTDPDGKLVTFAGESEVEAEKDRADAKIHTWESQPETRQLWHDYFDELCDLESEPQEIFEWWVVSDHLKYHLKRRGHPFLVNDYGTWWGRCTSGQSISIDGAIRGIVAELENVEISLDNSV